MWSLLPLLATLTVGPWPPLEAGPPLSGELVVAVEETTGFSVARLLRDWDAARHDAGAAPLVRARAGWAPAGWFDRGPALPLGEMVVQVPILSF